MARGRRTSLRVNLIAPLALAMFHLSVLPSLPQNYLEIVDSVRLLVGNTVELQLGEQPLFGRPLLIRGKATPFDEVGELSRRCPSDAVQFELVLTNM